MTLTMTKMKTLKSSRRLCPMHSPSLFRKAWYVCHLTFLLFLWMSANMDRIHSCRKSLKQALYRAWRYSTLCVISISRSSWVQRSTLSLVIMEVCTWYLVIYTTLTYNIIGGKSAILTAITIALGAKANSTNRGKNLSSLIREGAK